jgi:hypothetical protein
LDYLPKITLLFGFWTLASDLLDQNFADFVFFFRNIFIILFLQWSTSLESDFHNLLLAGSLFDLFRDHTSIKRPRVSLVTSFASTTAMTFTAVHDRDSIGEEFDDFI